MLYFISLLLECSTNYMAGPEQPAVTLTLHTEPNVIVR